MALATSSRLALERPYKDESGQPIHHLLDITHEGVRIPDRPQDTEDRLAENVRRIFQERGLDFFDKNPDLATLNQAEHDQHVSDALALSASADNNDNHEAEDDDPADPSSVRVMTTEELTKMRSDILQQLFVAHGELSLARDLLSSLLPDPVLSQLVQSAQPAAVAPTRSLTSTVVTGPAARDPAVQAFDAQLVVGGKDQGMRAAASILKTAASDVESARIADECYWVDALKLRRANWGLMPAPLPFGAGNTRASERPSTDFLISCGLEESPPALRRKAIGQLSTQDDPASSKAHFPFLQNVRLRVTLEIQGDQSEPARVVHNTWPNDPTSAATSLETSTQAAQREVVEIEIFGVLVREAGTLPTASVRVSEQLIVIEAAQGTQLRFELVSRGDEVIDRAVPADRLSARCDLIHAGLHLLLLRAHAHNKTRRLTEFTNGTRGTQSQATPPPPILRPLIDLIQYETFCDKVRTELERVARSLSDAGISTRVRFTSLGDSSSSILHLLNDVHGARQIGGEAILRIDGRHTIRFSLLAPSSLTVHLSHATLPIASIPQLGLLLIEESEHCLLDRIRELGQARHESVHGTWFVDSLAGCTIGRWEGGVQSFRVSLKSGSVQCMAFRMIRDQHQLMATYNPSDGAAPALFKWVIQQIDAALTGEDSTNI